MTAETGFRATIIIPSHNRRRRLLATLEALTCRQTHPLDGLELIVVADGCQDGTARAVRSYRAPFPIRVASLPGVGPSIARNRAVQLARSPLLIFLDDDVEPLPGWLGAHIAAHEQHPGAVVIGSYRPVPKTDGVFRRTIRGWWTAHFDELERSGHRFTFRYVMTGNMSMPTSLWRSLGGLDPDLPRAREDWELGVRLIEGGTPIVHAAAAAAWHHEYETLDLGGALRRAQEEGRSDVRLAAKHPHVKEALLIVRHWRAGGWRRKLARRVIAASPAARLGAAAVTGWVAEQLGARRSGRLFRPLFRVAQYLSYMHGAADELGPLERWRKLSAKSAPLRRRSLLIDLQCGLENAEYQLDAMRPDEVRLMFGTRDVGWLEYRAGAEPWSGRHLRYELAGRLAAAYLCALEKNGGLFEQRPQVEEAGKRLINAWPYVGSRGYFSSAEESMRQWRRSAL